MNIQIFSKKNVKSVKTLWIYDRVQKIQNIVKNLVKKDCQTVSQNIDKS